MRTLDIPTLTDCDCKAKVYADHSGVDLEYCDLHRLSPGLLGEANKTIRELERQLADANHKISQLERRRSS